MSADGDPIPGGPEDRLDSWKRIAAYLKRDVSTVQRWERREGMPVHRHLHDKLGSVFAFRSELDDWWRKRAQAAAGVAERDDAHGPEPTVSAPDAASAPDPRGEPRRGEPFLTDPLRTETPHVRARRLMASILTAALAATVAGGAWVAVKMDRVSGNPLGEAKFIPAAQFATAVHAAAISRDGRYVALLAERDGRTDAWLAEFGSEDYRDLTRGAARELVNPSIRTLGFSADSSLVSVWTRAADGSRPEDVAVFAAPTAGGPLEPYMSSVAELDWSPDGRRIVYHTTAPGDPMFVRDADTGEDAAGDAPVYVAPAGVHAHFPIWSPDGAYIYFVRGVPLDRSDIWRIRPSGSGLERITRHDTQVSYPVMLDRRTLMYLAKDTDGSGPWIYMMDVERRIPHRMSSGLEAYTSLAASRGGERLVATVAHRRTSLWRLPLVDGGVQRGDPTQLLVDGGRPRIGRDFVLFTAARGDRQGIWSLAGGTARELWSGARSRIAGALAIAPDGRRIAFVAEQEGKTRLYVMDSDGSNGQLLADSLVLRGGLAWWPDGLSVVAAVVEDGEPHLTRIFLNGDAPRTLVSEYSVDPVWSPGGRFLVYSGADVGTTFPLRAAEVDGRPHPIPGLVLTRGARRVAFLNERPALIFLRGELGHKDLWLIDLQSGAQRPLAELPQDFLLGDFDVSADGTEVILERIEESSSLALIERRQ